MAERIQMRRTKGWRKPEGAVYVGRPTRWGNLWRVGDPIEVRVMGDQFGPSAGEYDVKDVRHYDLMIPPVRMTAELAVLLYRVDLTERLADDDPWYDELRDALSLLRGHDQACWCSLDQPCHADVTLELANR